MQSTVVVVVVAVVVVVVVLVEVVEVVNGHSGQLLQNQFLQANSHPPSVDPQSTGEHCPVVVVVLDTVVVLRAE
jgi:hypothetical protein